MINVALFGFGRIGQMHAKNLSKNKKIKLLYVYEKIHPLSNKAKKLYGCKIEKNYYKIFDDKNVDIVFISSPTNTHIKFIEEGMKRKKTIFCEKPLDLNINKVIKCKKYINKYKPKIQLGFNRRYDPGHFALKKSLLMGKIGKLEKIIITSRDPAPPSFNYLKSSGGIFRDMTIHDFDMVRFYLGNDEINEIYATASNISNKRFNDIKDHELATCVIKSKKGVICTINNSRHYKYGYDQRIEIFGSKGCLISKNKKKYNFFIDRYKTAYKLQLQDLVNLANKNKKPRASFVDGEKALLLANAAYKSLLTKKVIKIR